MDAELLKVIQSQVRAMQSDMDIEEAKELLPRIIEFKQTYGHSPQPDSVDNIEHRLAIAEAKLVQWAQQRRNQEARQEHAQQSFRDEL